MELTIFIIILNRLFNIQTVKEESECLILFYILKIILILENFILIRSSGSNTPILL